jgi:Spy/CpxP family protein refolding chaperone
MLCLRTMVCLLIWCVCSIALGAPPTGNSATSPAATQPATAVTTQPPKTPATAASRTTAPAAATTAAASEPAEEEATVYVLSPFYQAMVKECELTDSQQDQLIAKLKEAQKELDRWDQANGPQVRLYQSQLVAAHKDSDEATVKQMTARLDDLSRARRRLQDKHEALAESVLTPKQRYAWQGFLLFNQIIPSFAGLELDHDQLTRARNICARTAPKIAKVKNDKAAADKLYDELYQSIRDRVLTDEQRSKLPAHPTTTPTSRAANAPS